MLIRACIATLILATVAAAETPHRIAIYAAQSRAERQNALAEAERDLEAARTKKTRNRKSKKELVDILEKLVEALEDPLQPYYAPMSLSSAKQGDIGYVHPGLREEDEVEVCTVFQVIDRDDMIVRVKVISDHRMDRESDNWVHGVPTQGLADDRTVALKGVFSVSGTRQYATAGGSIRTLPLLEAVDIETYRILFTRYEERRTWTAKGGYKMEAIYVRSERGKVTLMDLHGKTVEVDLADLSDPDRQYVRDQIAARREARRAASR